MNTKQQDFNLQHPFTMMASRPTSSEKLHQSSYISRGLEKDAVKKAEQKCYEEDKSVFFKIYQHFLHWTNALKDNPVHKNIVKDMENSGDVSRALTKYRHEFENLLNPITDNEPEDKSDDQSESETESETESEEKQEEQDTDAESEDGDDEAQEH